MTFALIAAALIVCWPRRKTKRRKRRAVSPAQQRKARDRAIKEAEKAEAKRQKDAAARAQAAEDIPYYEHQIDILTNMIEDAKAAYHITRQRVQYDAAMNQHGAIIKEKVVNAHITERDKAMKKVLSLERQIHTFETKLNKARAILDNKR